MSVTLHPVELDESRRPCAVRIVLERSPRRRPVTTSSAVTNRPLARAVPAWRSGSRLRGRDSRPVGPAVSMSADPAAGRPDAAVRFLLELPVGGSALSPPRRAARRSSSSIGTTTCAGSPNLTLNSITWAVVGQHQTDVENPIGWPSRPSPRAPGGRWVSRSARSGVMSGLGADAPYRPCSRSSSKMRLWS